jgi:hypothetical protein
MNTSAVWVPRRRAGLDAAELGEAAYTFELPGTVSASAPAP